MRKVSAFIAILVIAIAGFASPAQAATPKHNIKVLTEVSTGKAWAAVDKAFKARPSTQRAWLKQGGRLSVVGFSKTATATYPLRSIATKNHGGGFYVYAVSPAVKTSNVSAVQFKALERVLPACKHEDSLNCVWSADKRGNGRGKSLVNFPSTTFYKK